VNVATSARARSRIWSGLLWLPVAVALTGTAAAQGDSPAQAAIRGALTQWMEAFNAGDVEKACALFAPDLIAQVRGQGERGYAAQCDLLKRSLSDPIKTYSYALVVKEILVAGDVAVVRLTWTLKVRQKDTGKEITSDEFGIDVFRRQADGSWKIARFMSYDTSP
jgi:steroid delta-isomerase